MCPMGSKQRQFQPTVHESDQSDEQLKKAVLSNEQKMFVTLTTNIKQKKSSSLC